MAVRTYGRTDHLLPVLGTAGLLVIWQVLTGTLGLISDLVLPSPVAIAEEFLRVHDIIISYFWVTLTESLFGFVAALVVGIGLGILITLHDTIREAVMPYIVAGNSIPRVTLAPLIIFYIGGFQAKYLLAAWIAVFPFLINTIEGLSTIDEERQDLLSVFDATLWQEYRYVRFPAALPFIFDGAKLAISLAIIGAILGEFITGDRGLGALALIAVREHNLALTFAVLGLMAVASVLAFLSIYLLQDRIVHWQQTQLFVE